MKILRLFPLFIALAGLSGCDETPCFDGGSVAAPMRPGMILVGEETSLRLSPTFMSGCGPEETATPTSLTVEVSDPDNQPVEHHSSLGSTFPSLSTIRFTARKPGRHHVFAAFDPVGGIQQFDLHAATDYSREGPALTLPRWCIALARTQKGAFVCDQDVLRDGTSVQSFPASRLAVVGDVVWVVSASRIQRYVDTGSALTLTATLQTAVGEPEALQASENEVVVLYFSVLQRFTFTGTALATTGTAAWTRPTTSISTTGPVALAVRTGDRLGIVTRTTLSSTATPGYQVCPHGLEAGRFVRTAQPCSSFSGTVVGYEPDALWVADPLSFLETEFTSLRYLQWTAAGLVEQASLPLDFNLKLRTHPFQWRQTAVPTLTSTTAAINPRPITAVAVYSAGRRSILMDHLGLGTPETMASLGLIWAPPPSSQPTGSTVVRVRPSAP
ncbi:MAG TPA: hypothetical protein VK539_17925 [Myxococcaceae bacterium]|nr:hypothetical protein [Myxococcaceae bacterium]